MARNQDEADAIYVGIIKPGEACCGNCGWACPPWNPDLDGRYVNCAFPSYEDFPLKKVSFFFKCWTDDASVGVVPHWCEPYTKRRLTKEEIAANLSPQAVETRLRAKDNNGTSKRKAAELCQMSNGSPPKSTTSRNPIVSDHNSNVKPSISDVVRLQNDRIDFAWVGLEVLESATTNRDRDEVAKDLKTQLKVMDREINSMMRSL